MFRHIQDFIECRKHEAACTIKTLDAIPDKAAGQAVAIGHRDLKRLAWHLVETTIEMPSRLGLEIDGHELIVDGAMTAPPDTMAEIKAAYERANASLIKALGQWTDESLLIEDDMYGHKWTRSTSLTIIIFHEIHHRAEMIVLMRQAGLVPPGVYGPTKEGWAEFGMDAPKV